MYSRRSFLGTSVMAATGLSLAACRSETPTGSAASGSAAGAEARAASAPTSVGAGPLLTRAIPSTGERVPVIGAGTSGSFEANVGSEQYGRLKDVLQVFFDGGATVFDTSPNYGNADAVLGQLLDEGGWRQRTFLATKIAADSRPEAEAQWSASLVKLRTERVELLQVHNLRAWRTQLPYARELKAQGRTRYVGVTHYLASGLAEMEQILRGESLDFLQINYSVNAVEAASSVLPLAQDKGVAVLINRAFDDGKLFSLATGKPLPGWAAELGVTSWAQMFLKFAISHPAVTAVIPATSRPDRQADNLQAGRGPLLSEPQRQELLRLFA